MKVKSYVKLICVALVICFAVCGLTACGAKAVTLTVKDMGTETSVEAKTGMTVKEILDNAKITLGEKDETEPEKDSKIKEDTSEIIVKRYAKVTVVCGDQKKELEVVGATVEDAVKQSGLTVDADVKPDAPLTDYCTDGMTINLVKGVKLTVTADGKTTEVTTYMPTVEEMLKEQNITVSKDDEMNVKLTDKPADGMKITILRVTYKEEKKTEKIDYETEVKYSDSMSYGTSEVTQAGVEGEKEVTYKVKYVDGKEDSREKVSEKVTKEPVTEIVTKSSASYDSGSDDSGSGSYGSGSGGNDSGSGSGSGSDSGGSSGGDSGAGGVYEVSRQAVPDCDGSGHGYYIVTYSDGSTAYIDY